MYALTFNESGLPQGSTWYVNLSNGMTALAQRRNSDSRDDEIENLKKIIGDPSLVIDTFKNRSRE